LFDGQTTREWKSTADGERGRVGEGRRHVIYDSGKHGEKADILERGRIKLKKIVFIRRCEECER
jgi:hypothetical protein